MKVASFYRFLDLPGPRDFAAELLGVCEAQALLGTVLVATEGINGSIAGSEAGIRSVMNWIERRLDLEAPLEARWNETAQAPFRRMRVRLKKEIVALGRPDLLPHESTGSYVAAAQWNALVENPDVLVVDTRNHYEFEVGTFPGAIDPQTERFGEFVAFAEQLARTSRARPVAMFCTGGIRCEKATALMLELGFDEVYHLQGGILKYLEEIPAEDNLWDGECFVFDNRVAVDRDLTEGGYVQCHACRRPLSAADMASPDYREGVSCPKCVTELDDERAARLEERRKQVSLARERGDRHIGPK